MNLYGPKYVARCSIRRECNLYLVFQSFLRRDEILIVFDATFSKIDGISKFGYCMFSNGAIVGAGDSKRTLKSVVKKA